MEARFEIISPLRAVEVIASGRGVLRRNALDREYGKGRWRKMKGISWVRYYNGRTREVELHWYEAHGIGRVLFKIKEAPRER